NATVNGGTPSIGLTIGATGRNASYVSGSGTSALLFRYTTVSGDIDADGIVVASSITLNGGTIKDASGNNASLDFISPNSSGVVIDATAPTAALTYSPGSVAKSGSSLTITATFSEPLAVSPVVKLAISAVTGGTALAAVNMTMVDATHYKYPYTVQAGNGPATVTLSVGTDLAGNVVTSTPTSGATFTVDNTAPTASIVYSPTGPVRQGTTLTMTATFNGAMADSPVMQFAVTGANAVAATNMTGTDSTHYTGSYVVGGGDGT